MPGFVDRVYKATPDKYIFSRAGETLYDVTHSPLWKDTVVYNPWLGDKRGPKGHDYDDDGYMHNICLEPTVEGDSCAVLQPGEEWVGTQDIQGEREKRKELRDEALPNTTALTEACS